MKDTLFNEDSTFDDSDPLEEQKKKAHEANEAKRKIEWEEKQAAKKLAREDALNHLKTMADNDIINTSVKKLGLDAERLTRRNMKMCVTEHIQTLCLDNADFARMAMLPPKNMINCFRYINRMAYDFIKKEMDENDEKPLGYGMGSDVPDDLCYQWAEDYFTNLNIEEDQEKEEVFVPKPYPGKSTTKKKTVSKKKEPVKCEEKPAEFVQQSLTLD